MKSKKLKRLLSVFAAAAMAVTSLAVPVMADADKWDGTTVDKTWYTSNRTATEYTISTAAELAGLANIVTARTANFAGKTITLANDIDLGDYPWTPIGLTTGINTSTSSGIFCGIFDGGNHKISGLYIDTSVYAKTTNYLGLFSSVGSTFSDATKAAAVKNLTIKGAITDNGEKVKQMYYIGGLAGMSVGTIENVKSYVDIIMQGSGASAIGGIIGSAQDAALTSLTNYGNISFTSITSGAGGSTSSAGGVTGYSNGTATDLINYGSISVNIEFVGASFNVGGVIGSSSTSAVFKNFLNKGNVTSSSTATTVAGGVIGDYNSTGAENLVNEGAVTATASSYKASNTQTIGGVIGQTNNSAKGTLNQLANTGTVTGSVNVYIAGGVIGDLRTPGSDGITITNAYNTADVTIEDNKVKATNGTTIYAGGLVGTKSTTKSTIQYAYNTGAVSAANADGITNTTCTTYVFSPSVGTISDAYYLEGTQ